MCSLWSLMGVCLGRMEVWPSGQSNHTQTDRQTAETANEWPSSQPDTGTGSSLSVAVLVDEQRGSKVRACAVATFHCVSTMVSNKRGASQECRPSRRSALAWGTHVAHIRKMCALLWAPAATWGNSGARGNGRAGGDLSAALGLHRAGCTWGAPAPEAQFARPFGAHRRCGPLASACSYRNRHRRKRARRHSAAASECGDGLLISMIMKTSERIWPAESALSWTRLRPMGARKNACRCVFPLAETVSRGRLWRASLQPVPGACVCCWRSLEWTLLGEWQ